MLLSFTLENYRSFANEATLDMQASSFRTLRPRDGQSWDDVVLKRAAILGANASGKSNLIKPLGLLRQAINYSLRDDRLVKKLYDPHRMYVGKTATFIVEYVFEDIRYRWTLVLGSNGVVQELLEANAKRVWRLVFERDQETISFSASSGILKAARENIEQFLKPSTLCLSAWLTIKNPGDFIGAATWWQQSILPVIHCSDDDRNLRHEWVKRLTKNNLGWLELMKLVISSADVGVVDVSVQEDVLPEELRPLHIKINRDDRSVEISDELPEDAPFDEYMRYLEFHHVNADGDFVLKEQDESLGTQVWIDYIIPALYVLYNGALLIVDELDSSLHPGLLREFIHYFYDPEINSNGAQLIFTTHDLTLLGKHPTESLGRDEVWFVEKQDSRSELVALSEFSVRDAHNIEKRYFQGAFGALPITSSQGIAAALEALREKRASA